MDADFKRKLFAELERYGGPDCDTLMLFRHWDVPPGSRVLEVGANEEYSACAMEACGYYVIGVDLREQVFPFSDKPSPYQRITADFVQWAKEQPDDSFDAAFSTSALEHFGLPVYGQQQKIGDYDAQAVAAVYRLLRPGGLFYCTVPFGCPFLEDGDWRVYDDKELTARYIQGFEVIDRRYFKSGECQCKDNGWDDVPNAAANSYSGVPPHVTVLLVLRKPA